MIKPIVIEKSQHCEAEDLIGSLEELGIEIATYKGRPRIFNGEVKCFCPFHDDYPKPSFSVNIVTGLWHCWSNCGGGNWEQLLSRLGRTDITHRPLVPDSIKKVYQYEKIFREKIGLLQNPLATLIDRTRRSNKYHEKVKAEYFISGVEDRISELCKITEKDSLEDSLKTLDMFIEEIKSGVDRWTRKV